MRLRAALMLGLQGLGLLILSLGVSTRAHAQEGLSLHIADAPRPGIVEGCEMLPAASMRPDPWRLFPAAVQINWQGGGTLLNPQTRLDVQGRSLQERCFRLDLDGRPLVGGAVVARRSARLLRFPVLLVEDDVAGRPPLLTLQAELGGGPATPSAVPARWLGALQQRFAPRLPNPDSVPLMRVSRNEQPVQLVAVAVRTAISGALARTRLDLNFLNPNARALEGELQFPLREGQTLTGFALESPEGVMMPAVPVPKARGQEVFESIERRNVDPALLEQTVGNNFKLRVFPLLPGKTRRVSLEITELLAPDSQGRLSYHPPLHFGAGARPALNLLVEFPGFRPRDLRLDRELQGARILQDQQREDTLVLLEQGDFRTAGTPGLSWQPAATDAVLLGRFDGEDYFHADVPLDVAPALRPRPEALALIWDASASAAGQDRARQFALLDAYFRELQQVRVQLVIARDVAEPVREFQVSKGNWQALRAVLEQTPYDGASQAAAWRPPAGFTQGLALLFSDGLANWGEAPAGEGAVVPVYAISSSARVNSQLLRGLAESSGGQYLDLLQMSAEAALAELKQVRPRIRSLHGAGLSELAAASVYPRYGRIRLAGRMTVPRAVLTVELQLPDGRTQQREITIAGKLRPAGSELAAQRWALYRIAELEENPARHRAAIERLSMKFGVVSSQTSLIVLESLEDHLRYGVPPPPGPLRLQYDARRQAADADTPARRSRHLDQLAQRFAAWVKWWETDYPKGEPPRPEPQKEREALRAAQEREGSQRRAMAPAPLAMPAPRALVASAASAADSAAQGPAPTIRLQKWQPDAAYARRLREAADADRYAIYLDERPAYTSSTAFFLDAAEIFFDKGQTELAVRVLSNLTEMDLENRQVLRVLAYRLMQAEQDRLALPLLQRVRELAPEEPQSWRDLGLAQAELGQAQLAVNTLWEVVSRPWDARFADIDLIALAELNAIAARHPGLDLGAVDPRLQRNLPLDLRAVLAWDADNTDIDLWVIDPNGEKAYFAHALTYQGGRMTRDFTAGYGPEAFSLKTAKPGRYEVRAQFYGHRQQVLLPYTTLMLKLTTGFGSAAQKDSNVVLRLGGKAEEVLVGTFDVRGRP